MGPRSAVGEAVSFVGLGNATGGSEGGEALVQGGGADAAAGAQFAEGHGADDVGNQFSFSSSAWIPPHLAAGADEAAWEFSGARKTKMKNKSPPQRRRSRACGAQMWSPRYNGTDNFGADV